MDAVNSRLPPPRARIAGMAASVVTSTVRKFRSMASSKGLQVHALDGGRTGMADVIPDEVEALEAIAGFPHDAARVVVLGQIRDDPVRAVLPPR